jgi:hypothetical protein
LVLLLSRLTSRTLILLLPSLVAAQESATGTIVGRVLGRVDTVTAVPIEGATVSVLGTPLRVATRADGGFALDGAPRGQQIVRIRVLGYRTVERAISVAGDTTSVDVTLQPEARLLAPIRADARANELELFESRPSVATVAVSAAAMAGIPKVGEPDVVRVVQLLPGVASRNDFNAGFNVRGGEADQNLVLLDGYPIYNPFHVGGLFSTFMDATVGGVTLMTGAFPARYGGRLSSVLDVRSVSETRPGINTIADVSVLGATAKLGGLYGSGRGSWSVAGRRTYADAATAAFTTSEFPYHFRDFHGRATYTFAGGVRVAVTAYAGKDVLDLNFANQESDSTAGLASDGRWSFDWGNRVLGASVSRDFGGLALEQRVSTSGFSTAMDVGDGAVTRRNAIGDVRLDGSLVGRGATHEPSVGYEVATYRIRYAIASPQTATTEFDLVQRPLFAAVWASDLWRLSPRWLLEGGVRAEALSGRDWAALSPRVSAKYFATPNLALTAAVGRVTQVLHSLAGDGPLRYFDIWLASDSLTPVTTAWHGVVGAERRVGDALTMRMESYVKKYERVLEANLSEDPQRPGDEFLAAQGSSYGLDLLTRWRTRSGPSGWVAYSYSFSSRSRDGERWSPAHDRRHELDAVATWQLARYRLGARFGFATGTPYTPIIGQIARRVYDPSLDRWGTGDAGVFVESVGGPRNGARFPAAHRLDLDVSREFRVGGATLGPYVSVVNVYNAQNVFVYLYEYSTDQPTRRAISQFPVLPSLGVRVVF